MQTCKETSKQTKWQVHEHAHTQANNEITRHKPETQSPNQTFRLNEKEKMHMHVISYKYDMNVCKGVPSVHRDEPETEGAEIWPNRGIKVLVVLCRVGRKYSRWGKESGTLSYRHVSQSHAR